MRRTGTKVLLNIKKRWYGAAEKYDYTSYDDNTPYYTMIIKEDGRKIKLLLDLTEEMLHTIKTQHPEKVYFA